MATLLLALTGVEHSSKAFPKMWPFNQIMRSNSSHSLKNSEEGSSSKKGPLSLGYLRSAGVSVPVGVPSEFKGLRVNAER